MEQLTAIEKQIIKNLLKTETKQQQAQVEQLEKLTNKNFVDIQNIAYLKADIERLKTIIKKLGG